MTILFSLISCTKADPNAYRGDPILQDYKSQMEKTKSDLEALKKQMEDTKKEMNISVPQSGQYGVQRRRLYDMESKAARLEQQLLFWQIRIESRAKEAQVEYLNAFKEKKPWPDKEKVDAYMTQKRLRVAKMNWDQKDRLDEYKKSKKHEASESAESSQPPPEGGH